MFRSRWAPTGMLLAAVLSGGCASAPTPNGPGAHVTKLPDRKYVDDPALAVLTDSRWASDLQTRLASIARSSGVTILVQFHAKSPPADEDRNPGDYMRALATRLGVIKDSVLMVHFADDPDWRVWVGDDLTPRFVGRPGDARGFTESGAMHEAKEAYLKAAMNEAKLRFEGYSKTAPTTDVSARRELELETDALVDGLCAKLGLR